MAKKEHWEKIFATKPQEKLTWFQNHPKALVECLHTIELSKDGSIIDIGGGDSLVPDTLLKLGYKDITVLDVSSRAIQRSQKRLGENAENIAWIEKDILSFHPARQYDFWYDRAVFHFLTDPSDIRTYVEICAESIRKDGYFLLGTFSEDGPEKCSGLDITQYSEEKMLLTFKGFFKKITCFKETHHTSSGGTQSFQFCLLKKG